MEPNNLLSSLRSRCQNSTHSIPKKSHLSFFRVLTFSFFESLSLPHVYNQTLSQTSSNQSTTASPSTFNQNSQNFLSFSVYLTIFINKAFWVFLISTFSHLGSLKFYPIRFLIFLIISSLMDEIEVPPYFLCPISLEIMKDPVIVSTGITYDRNSIEKWIFFSKNNTCPVTKQVLSDSDLTPNHTLRRLIQSWCTLNASHGMERFPTPKQPINKAQIVKLLNDAKSSQLQMKCLTRLRVIASESETNKRCMEAAGAVEFLASLVSNTYKASLEEVSEDGIEFNKGSDEALSILYYLQLSDTGLRTLTGKNGEFIETLMHVMQRGNYESRAYAVLLLKSMLEVADDPMKMISLKPVFFIDLVQLLHDQISYKASKATLNLLINLCPWGRNMVKAVDSGAVSLLIDLLLDSSEKRICEMMLMVLDQLCHCAEGRAELMKHGAGLAIVSKKILRVSHVASERAVNILLSISKFSASPRVLQEMLQLGVVAKLCLVIQVDCGSKTKKKAKEVLKLHGRTWKNSPCIPMNLLSLYPS